ncbi:HAMP domain-containing histidine kinase [bacterium]|nr:HAMP domain-containing histidine kinase [bacterium]
MKFTKSLKFKLTIWYSVILSVFCIVFVVGINIWLTNYMQQDIVNPGHDMWISKIGRNSLLRNLTSNQMEIVMESRLADLDNIRTITGYAIAPLVLFSFGAGYVLADIMLRPLEKLNEEIKKKEAKNLHDEIVFVDNGDEISQLIKSFNRMSARLGGSFDAQREFVENASHELKTPLAIIQANLDTAIEDDSVSKKELVNLLKDSKKSIKFMNILTEDLLLLSILDHSVEKEDLDLKNLLSDVVFQLESFAKKTNISIKTKFGKGGFNIEGNEVLLQRAFMNVVENGIKYSGGDMIEIVLKKEKKRIVVSIKDNGKGISKEHQRKIFERFYRVEKSRSRSSGGSGLGLAITKEIINKHEGSIKIASDGKDGTEFVIKLSA